MDADIYDELDNYEHITENDKIREEELNVLRQTNKELNDEINRLREANRNVSETLEQLRNNFNSLLKTAQAELERKNEMINTLNSEKDQLIFRQIGNRNTPGRRFNTNFRRESNKETNAESTKGIKRKMNSPQSEDSKVRRLESDTISADLKTDNSNIKPTIDNIQCQTNKDENVKPRVIKPEEVKEQQQRLSTRIDTATSSSCEESETNLYCHKQTEEHSSIFKTQTVENEKMLPDQLARNTIKGIIESDKPTTVSKLEKNKRAFSELFSKHSTVSENSLETEKGSSSGKEDKLEHGKGSIEEENQCSKNIKEYRIPKKYDQCRGTLKTVKYEDKRKEDDYRYKSNTCKEDQYRKIQKEEYQGSRKQDDYRDTRKDEDYQGARTEEDNRSCRRSRDKQRYVKQLSRESGEHESNRYDKIEHSRFSRSYSDRTEPNYRYKIQSRYEQSRLNRIRRQSPIPREGDRDVRGRAPSRYLRRSPSAKSKKTERLVSPPYERKKSIERFRSAFKQEVSYNSSCERQRDRVSRDNERRKSVSDHLIKENINEDTEGRISVEKNTEVISDHYSTEIEKEDFLRKETQPIRDSCEIKQNHDQTKEIMGKFSHNSEKPVHMSTSSSTKTVRGNVLSMEIRMCESPEEIETASKLSTDTCKRIEDTGWLTVFDDPRLYSIKYFNDDEIGRNVLLKSNEVKQLSETDFKVGKSSVDICLQILNYDEQCQEPKIDKTTEKLIRKIYREFSDSSTESGELDDSFDSDCDIKKVISDNVRTEATNAHIPIVSPSMSQVEDEFQESIVTVDECKNIADIPKSDHQKNDCLGKINNKIKCTSFTTTNIQYIEPREVSSQVDNNPSIEISGIKQAKPIVDKQTKHAAKIKPTEDSRNKDTERLQIKPKVDKETKESTKLTFSESKEHKNPKKVIDIPYDNSEIPKQATDNMSNESNKEINNATCSPSIEHEKPNQSTPSIPLVLSINKETSPITNNSNIEANVATSIVYRNVNEEIKECIRSAPMQPDVNEETKQATNIPSIEPNVHKEIVLEAFIQNNELDKRTDSDGASTNTQFITSTPNPNMFTVGNLNRDFCIMTPIKEPSELNIELLPQNKSITPSNEKCVQSNNVSQSEQISDTPGSCIGARQIIISRRRRVIVKKS